MIVKDSKGREIELSVQGTFEEPYIVDAYFVDSGDEVDDETVTYIYDNYQAMLMGEAFQYQVARAEDYADSLKDGTYE